MNQMVGEKVSLVFGSLEMVDVDTNDIGWGKYLRVKVLIDRTKPFVRGLMVKFNEKNTWVTCKYERLPKFYFLVVSSNMAVFVVLMC